MSSVPDPDDEARWVPDDVDRTRPNPARMYDYYLGGAHNFAADRELARAAIAVMPWMPAAVRANRGFLRRAVAWCARQGVDQFLDLGAGVATVGAVHDVVRPIRPGAQVVYVDNDPVAAAHGRLMLAEVPAARMVEADLLDPEALLAHPEVAAVLDLARPIALLTVAVLHFVTDPDRAAGVLAGYRAHLAPGSALVFSHVTADHDPDEADAAVGVYRRSSTPVHTRSHAELLAMLRGFDLVEPGLVDARDWHRDGAGTGPVRDEQEHAGFYAAVGRPVGAGVPT